MTQLTKQTTFVDKDYIEVNLDLHDKSSTSQVEQCYTLMQNNHNSRVLRCILTKGCGLLPVDLSNSALTLYIKKADLALVMLSGQIVDAKNGIVDFALTRQALAIADKITCEVIKTGVDKSTMSFPNFILEIDSTIIDEDLVESTNDFSALNDTLARVTEWDGKFTGMYNDLDKKVDTEIGEVNTQLSHNKTFLSVAEYGATGDGVTDNTVFFKKALSDAYDKGLPLKIPSGVYAGNFEFNLDESINGENGNTPLGNINVKIKIFGEGEKSILKPVKGSGIKLKGNSTQSLRSFTIENITIDGGDRNVHGIEIEKSQNIAINNVFIWNCKKSGLYLNGAMDIKINNLNLIGCGGVSDKVYYSVDMLPLTGVQSTNAIHITNSRIEVTPLLLRVVGSDQIYLSNCKFEKANVNLTDNRPLFIDGSSSITFEGSVFTNNSMDVGLQDVGKYFLEIGQNQSQSIKFIGCDFITPTNQTCNWFKGGYALFSSCLFDGCDGSDMGYAFMLDRSNVIFNSCIVNFDKNSKLFLVNSDNCYIDIKLNNKDSVWEYPIFSITDSNFFNIEYDYINVYPSTSYKAVYLADYYKISEGFFNSANGKFRRKLNNQFEATGYVITDNPYEIVKMSKGNFAGCRNTYDGYDFTLLATGEVVVVTSQNIKTRSGQNVSLTNNQVMRFVCINGQLYEV